MGDLLGFGGSMADHGSPTPLPRGGEIGFAIIRRVTLIFSHIVYSVFTRFPLSLHQTPFFRSIFVQVLYFVQFRYL